MDRLIKLIFIILIFQYGCNKNDGPCQFGYEGEDCNTRRTEKFAGTYYGMNNCFNEYNAVYISENKFRLDTIIINNNNEFLFGVLNSRNSFDIPSQNITINEEVINYKGNGNLENNTITINYIRNNYTISHKETCGYVAPKLSTDSIPVN